MSYQGDYLAASTVVFNFNTVSFTDGSPITLAGTPALSVYKNSTTESTAGITLTVDYDSRTGMHHVVIDTSADGTFYAAGNDFDVIITAGTVGGTSVVGRKVGSFSLQNRTQYADVRKALGNAVTTTTNGILDVNTKNINNVAAATNANNFLKVSLNDILATTLTETSGQLAGGFKQFFNVATPTGTVNSLPNAVAGASGGLFIAGTNASLTITGATTFTGVVTASNASNNIVGIDVAKLAGSTTTVTNMGTVFANDFLSLFATGVYTVQASPAPTSTVFRVNASWDTGTLNDQLFRFSTGGLVPEAKPIKTSVQIGGSIMELTFDEAFTAAPTAGDTGVAIATHVHPITQIASGVWQDTTAGDFTVSASIGKSIMNGVALGTGLTVNDITTKTGYSLANGSFVTATFGTCDFTSTMKTSLVTVLWDGTISGHTTTGTFGGALNAAGSAGDPWSTVLPGAYSAGTAGHIVGTALPDIAAGSAGGLFIAGSNAATTVNFTGNLSGSVGSVTSGVTVVTNNDKTGYSLTQSFPTNFSSLAITGGGAVTAGTVSDKTGYALSSSGTDLVLVAGKTLPNALKYIGAVVAGAMPSGAGSGTEAWKDFSGTVAVTVTVDASGNRTAVVYA